MDVRIQNYIKSAQGLLLEMRDWVLEDDAMHTMGIASDVANRGRNALVDINVDLHITPKRIATIQELNVYLDNIVDECPRDIDHIGERIAQGGLEEIARITQEYQ